MQSAGRGAAQAWVAAHGGFGVQTAGRSLGAAATCSGVSAFSTSEAQVETTQEERPNGLRSRLLLLE